MFKSLKMKKGSPASDTTEVHPSESGETETADREQAERQALENMRGPQEKAEFSEPSSISSPETDEATHFEVDDLLNQPDDTPAGKPGASAVSAPGLMPKEMFVKSFFGIHGFASRRTGIKALALPNEIVDANLASETASTLYETIIDIPMLHFILQPGNKWLGRAFVMVMYVDGMKAAIDAERRQGAAEHAGNFSQAKAATEKPKDGDLNAEQAAILAGA